MDFHHPMEPYEQFLKDIPESIKHFPELIPSDKDGKTILSGFINLIATDGVQVDRYQIEIHPTSNYPKSYPFVYEIGGRLPKNIDFHIYPDGHFCIAVPAQERVDCAHGINLSGFIQNQVLGFLFSQTFRSQNGYFYQERAHGPMGKLQFYNEYLGLSEGGKVLDAMKMIASNKEQGSRSPCFCGSQSKFHKCHRRIIRDLKKTAGDVVTADFNEIIEILIEHKRNPKG